MIILLLAIFGSNLLYYFQLHPTEGMIRRNNHLKMGRYHQHLHELLEMDLSPLDYMLKMFPEFKDRDEMRKVIGRYGISGKAQVGHNDTTNSKYLLWEFPK